LRLIFDNCAACVPFRTHFSYSKEACSEEMKVIALKRGGADTPANMQWQTVAEAKAKDRVE